MNIIDLTSERRRRAENADQEALRLVKLAEEGPRRRSVRLLERAGELAFRAERLGRPG